MNPVIVGIDWQFTEFQAPFFGVLFSSAPFLRCYRSISFAVIYWYLLFTESLHINSLFVQVDKREARIEVSGVSDHVRSHMSVLVLHWKPLRTEVYSDVRGRGIRGLTISAVCECCIGSLISAPPNNHGEITLGKMASLVIESKSHTYLRSRSYVYETVFVSVSFCSTKQPRSFLFLEVLPFSRPGDSTPVALSRGFWTAGTAKGV